MVISDMVISDKKEFVFIHVPKCAGISISNVLSIYGRTDNKTLLSKILYKLKVPEVFIPHKAINKHVKANDLKGILPGKVWNNYFKFAFVRNPFDYQVSNYHYILRSPSHPYHKEVKECKCFKKFLYKQCNDFLTSKPNILSRYVYDDSDNLMVDYLGRFENLNKDFDKICKILNIRYNLPHMNKSNRKSYHDYYDEESRLMIEEHHAKDLEIFGYKF